MSDDKDLIVIADDDAFDEIWTKQKAAESDKVVFVFSASWCGPCKRVKPHYLELSKANPDITFYYIDIDNCEDAADAHEVSAVPTFKAYQGATLVEQVKGASPDKITALVKTLADK
jgi:thioredoxin